MQMTLNIGIIFIGYYLSLKIQIQLHKNIINSSIVRSYMRSIVRLYDCTFLISNIPVHLKLLNKLSFRILRSSKLEIGKFKLSI